MHVDIIVIKKVCIFAVKMQEHEPFKRKQFYGIRYLLVIKFFVWFQQVDFDHYQIVLLRTFNTVCFSMVTLYQKRLSISKTLS